MPIPRVKFVVTPVSAAARVQFRTLVEAQFTSKPVTRWRRQWTTTDKPNEILVEFELGARKDMDDFRQWFQDNLATMQALVNGTVKMCLCSHDDAVVVPCNDSAASTYREVRL